MLKIYLIGCLCAALANLIVFFKSQKKIDKSFAADRGAPACNIVKIYAGFQTTLFAAFFSWISFFVLLCVLTEIEREENDNI